MIIQVVIAQLFYFGLIAYAGYRRGLRRELLVLAASGGTLLALRWFSLRFPAPAAPATSLALGDAMWRALFDLPAWRALLQQSPLFLLLWLLACGLAYGVGQQRLAAGRAPHALAGALAAAANGWIFLHLLLPWLTVQLSLGGLGLANAFALPALPVDAQAWLAAAQEYRATLLVIAAIGLLVYWVSRRHRPSAS